MNKFVAFFRDFSIARFFIPAGLILVTFSVFVFNSVDHAKNFIKTEAIVTRADLYEDAYVDGQGNHQDATYTVYVKYTVDGTEYEEEYGVFSNYRAGDKVTISYNPDDPKEITQPNSIILPICIAAAGGAFLVIGIVSTVNTVKKRKALKLQEQEWSK